MSENKHILQDILREEWGFKGTIVSDFEGVYATVPSVLAGVALELPGPARFRGKHLLEAIKEGKIPESKIDNLVKDVIALSKKVGMNDAIRNEPDVEKTDSTATLVKNIATEGIVLLKNKDNILPLLPSKKQKIAIFGSPAASPIIHGGGSASLTASYVVSPLESLERTFGIENIKYHPGVPIFKKIPSASKSIMTTVSNGQLGLDCHWYNGWEFGENEIYHEILETTRTLVIESRIKELKAKHCSRMDFILHPRTTGTHTFGVTACGESVLRVDGKEIVRHAGFPDCRVEYVMQPGDFEVRGNVDVVAGQEYHVTIDTLSTTAPSPSPIFDITPQATSVGFYENLNTINSQEISTLAAECDVSFVFTANNKEYESESFDRSSMSLSPLQDQLITMVATSASKTVLVNATGSPITMPWIDDVDAILQCWYAGQEIGNALACVISGEVSPSAKLPVTFPKCIEDSPSFGNFPTDKNMEIRYAERGNMGYRARNQPTPLFPFGYGLSFTEFEFNDLALKRQSSAEPTDVIISTRITNTGSRSGREVMQIYIDGILKGFNKVFLNPGETQKVEVFLDKYAFSEWDTESGSWVVQARTYSIELRSDANKIVSLVTYNLMTSMSWNGL
jgi:beta-glucosidase